MRPPSAVLLELEGVIASTHAARRESLLRSLVDDGVTIGERTYDDLCHGLPVRGAVRAALEASEVAMDETGRELVALRAERYFLERVSTGLTLAEGSREALETLHSRARLAVVTRAARREADMILGAADAAFLFESVVTADDTPTEPKPAPAPYRLALVRLGRRRAIVASDAIALEDGRAGIRAARGAGIRCLAVGDVPAFRALDADGYLPTLRGATVESLGTLAARGGTGQG
ncbi:MAG TPA: HAD family phosphatase [Gemmatimonadaceae bacterium]|nr:HAD family phosphatase [Gemmatimonadaceae bacterium]